MNAIIQASPAQRRWTSVELAISSAFPGGSITVDAIAGATVRGRIFQEAICHADGAVYDYSRHFCFGLTNLTSAPVDVEVLIGCESAAALPRIDALLFTGGSPDEEFTQTPLASRTDVRKAYAFTLPLRAGETRYVANYFFRPYDALVRLFDDIGAAAGGTREVIDHSVDGRPLTMWSWRRRGAGRPVVVMTSGVHPPEPDTLATEAIIRHLATDEGRRWLDAFDIHIVPLANPDGFVHGYSGCNARQVNFYWLFRPEAANPEPETVALWRLMERLQPVLYFDWHGYTFQQGARHAAPYVKPVALQHGARVRSLVRQMNEQVRRPGGGHQSVGFLTFAPSTLAPRLTARFNTITYAKYHIELRLGIARNRALAVEVVRAALETLQASGLSPADILLAPAGRVAVDPSAQLASRYLLWWFGRARPALGRLRRLVIGRAA